MAARKEAPGAAKVTVFDAVTGAALVRWSIDAKDLVASGAATWEPPVADEAPVAEPPAPEPVADEAPVAERQSKRR